MKKYLLPKDGKFYKANLHCHSTVSDGSYTPEELKIMYMEQGYSVVAYTDHYVLIPHDELTDDNFVALNGVEVDIVEDESEERPTLDDRRACHLCYIALDKDNKKHPVWHRSAYCWDNTLNYAKYVEFDENEPDYIREYTSACVNDMIKRGRDRGFFVTYNHPVWTLEEYPIYMSYEGMNAMEIFNNCGYVSGYDEYVPAVYDAMLRSGKRLYCIAADDNHNSIEQFFGGYVMIKADKLEYSSITKALYDGNFYSSRGPEIYDLWVEDAKIHITCSDAKMIAMVTSRRRTKAVFGEHGKPVTEAAFDVVPEDKYIRLTVTDIWGNTANTNAYFVDSIL